MTTILLLNLLISIVSETYNEILEIETVTRFKGRLQLNEHYSSEFFWNTDMTRTIQAMVFCCKTSDSTNGGGDEDDKGTTKRIKK